MRWMLAAIAALCVSCASVPTPHPTLENPIHACYVGCPFGYSTFGAFRQQQYNCRSDRRNLTDITVTAEEDVAGSPDESRWFTGYLNTAAEGLIIKRLAARGITQASREWASEFGVEEKQLREEYGDSVRAAYPKIHVILQTCTAVRDAHCLMIGTCGNHPGEPDPTGRDLH